MGGKARIEYRFALVSRTEHDYLRELASRASAVLGGRLVGVYAGGSWAIGDYVGGRSDLDVAIVSAGRLDDPAIDALVERLRHESLPCPARVLELVVYTRAVAGAGRPDPGFELNLNTGASTPLRVERHAQARDGHWFVIDRSLLADHGRAIAGPPAADVFRSAPREVVLGALAQSLRWHQGGDAALDDAALNTARALHYAREGRWTSKGRAARWMIERGEHSALMNAALAARHGSGVVDSAAVRAFIGVAAEALGHASHAGSR